MQRYVIYNQPIDISCIYYAKDVDSAIKALMELVDKYQKGKLGPNKLCRKETLEKYNPNKISMKLHNIWGTL